MRHRITLTIRIFTAALCALFLLTLNIGDGSAQDGSLMDRKTWVGRDQEPWQIEADKLAYDQKAGLYEAEGSVRISSGDRLIRADRAQLDSTNERAELWGNVELYYGKDWLKGDHVVWNLDTETGWADGGIVYFSENNFYVQGKQIAKTGPNRYELSQGFITSCDPYDPDWVVRYGQMRVDVGGWAWAKNTSLWAGKVPVMYFPVAALPVAHERQSGLLLPVGAVSDLNGVEVEIPFYWAIRKDMDATLYGNYMQKRGFMSGLEYRIANRTFGEGIWVFNYLDDRADRDHLKDTGYPFITNDRYWLRARHSFYLPAKIHGWLNLDLVSDRNFLREFETGSASHAFTDELFLKFSGQGLIDTEYDDERESSLYLSRPDENMLMAMDTRYWDNLNPGEDESTLQQLPKFIFNIVPSPVQAELPLYYSLQSSLANFWREEGDSGNRLDLYPRVYYPMHWKQYLDFQPSVGLRSSSYLVDWQENSTDSWQTRLIPDVRLDLTSRLSRIYSASWGNTTAVENVIRPELGYVYMPEVNQDDIPMFTDLDRIEERHGIRYGFSTYLTTKRITKALGAGQEPVTSYHEMARLRVTQTLNIKKETPFEGETFVGLGGIFPDDTPPEIEAEPLPERRFSNVNVELDVTPQRYLTLSYDTSISPYGDPANAHDVTMSANSLRGQWLSLSYRFREGSVINELIAQTGLQLTSRFSFNTYHDYNVDSSELFEQTYGLTYQEGCWSIQLIYNKEVDDQKIGIAVNLLGLGALGGDFSPRSSSPSSGGM